MPFDIRSVCGEIEVPKQEFHGKKLEYTKRNQSKSLFSRYMLQIG